MKRAWCGTCGVHFSQTSWSQASGRSSSRSQNRKGAGKRGESQKEAPDPLRPFTAESPKTAGATPWRPSTPATRAQQALWEKQSSQYREDQAIVPPPESKDKDKKKDEAPGGASAECGESSADLMAQAEAIKQALGSNMTDEMKKALDKMTNLQERPKPKLTHSHLSKVERAQKAVDVLKAKVIGLDQAWEGFKKVVADRVATQKGSYMEQRKALTDQYMQKVELLKQLQLELQKVAAQGSGLEVVDLEGDEANFDLDFDADIEVIPDLDEPGEPKPSKRPKTEENGK